MEDIKYPLEAEILSLVNGRPSTKVTAALNNVMSLMFDYHSHRSFPSYGSVDYKVDQATEIDDMISVRHHGNSNNEL